MLDFARQQAAWAGTEAERRTGAVLKKALAKATTPLGTGPSTEAPPAASRAWQAGFTPIGGRLLIAEVTRQAITVRTVAQLA